MSYLTVQLVFSQGGGLNCARPPQEAKCNDFESQEAVGPQPKERVQTEHVDLLDVEMVKRRQNPLPWP